MKNIILLDKPYVSDFLKDTIVKNHIEVLDTEVAKQMANRQDIHFISAEEVAYEKRQNKNTLIFSNSENNISWVEQNLNFSDLPSSIHQFKNKITFRDTIKNLFPDFFFMGVKFNDLPSLNVDELKFPFIIKPAIGFFSMGVHTVETKEDWVPTLKVIQECLVPNRSN